MSFGRLRIELIDGSTAVHMITKPVMIIGRSPNADIHIPDRLVSNHHAQLSIDDHGLWLTDLSSTNGTFVDGIMLISQERIRLQEGLHIQIGDATMQFIPSLGNDLVDTPVDLSLLKPEPLDEPTPPHRWRDRLIVGIFALLILILLAIGLFFLWPRSSQETVITPTETSMPATLGTFTPCQHPPITTVPIPIESAAFLDLPFPYNGGNEQFGGSQADFRRAIQRASAGGRINSFFDHLYPLYPAPQDPGVVFGREPTELPISQYILLFDGQLSSHDNYSGHPAYDFSTFVPRQPTTPVFAAADGLVQEVGEHSSGALYVKLGHTITGLGSFQTIYWHLHHDPFFTAMQSQIGELITAGTRIGTMGNTGWSTGHHLHFEVRFDRNRDGRFTADETVDPFGFMPNDTYPTDPWGQSVSFIDGRGDTYNHTASISDYLWIHPISTQATIPPAGGGQLNQPKNDPLDNHNTLCIEPDTFPPGSTISWSWSPDPPYTDELIGVGHSCALTATDTDGNFMTNFTAPIRVEIPFSPLDIVNIIPETLRIYWLTPESDQWQPLATTLDLEQGIATATTTQPGYCSLRGRPIRDMIPPTTRIQVEGLQGVEGAWYDMVTVTIISDDVSGVANVEYSLDAGTTWQPYRAPFILQTDGVLAPLPDTLEEDFGSGPGRFLVLVSATDNAGNMENPPTSRYIVIDPEKAPVTSAEETSEATPTAQNTATAICEPIVEATVNANVRWGPDLIYFPVAALNEGETAPIIGRNEDSSWWRIALDEPAGFEFWIANTVVRLPCDVTNVPLVSTPIPPTRTPTPTFTPTPTETPSPTPTLTPTVGDSRAPEILLTYAPSRLTTADVITITATAIDNVQVSQIEIWAQSSTDNQLVVVHTCQRVSICIYVGGPYAAGELQFIGYAWDVADNRGISNLVRLTVIQIPQ